ncbi:MAG TPA: ABC transporter ATP-binding protein [Thermomicrobiales bacterium]|jgi:spermidine/putrescine transport system ATP-binding protein|nr:ABC transporter ATP-binding protein [Thermomicrobiales bacterium]
MSMHVDGQGARIELISLEKRFNGVVAVRNIDMAVQPGEFLTMLGPSGCGKTTTLRMIGGFEYPTGGQIMIDGQDVAGLQPHRRPVNTVFQQYALFPHMTVARNVGYGLEMAGVGKGERERRVVDALAMVRLANVERRKPSELSGGQQQRVALARALINRPKALLLDEPLGALDLKLRKAMQLELKQLNRETGATFIYVTHDQEEALTMSDRIAVMNEGRILQLGTPAEIYEHPVDRFVADFIGQSNLIPGVLEARNGETGAVRIATGGLVEARLRDAAGIGDRVVVSIRPERITLDIGQDGGPGGAMDGVVSEIIYLGSHNQLVLHVMPDLRLAANVPTDFPAGPGDRASLHIPTRYATCFAAE